MLETAIAVVVVVLVVLKNLIHILPEYERGVIFTLGRLGGLFVRDKGGVRGPGIVFTVPFMQKLIRIDTRTITMDIPTQDVITKDNISIKVNAVLYYRVLDPGKAFVQVEDYHYATSQLAQTTLRSICGEIELDELLTQREDVNHRIQSIIDKHTDPWGIKVSMVEVKHIDLPQEMQRAMAKQAEAERERRAKVIQAEGEFQAAQKLTDAAKIMGTESITLQLRYLETLRDIAAEHNSTILFPIPIDFMQAFMKK